MNKSRHILRLLLLWCYHSVASLRRAESIGYLLIRICIVSLTYAAASCMHILTFTMHAALCINLHLKWECCTWWHASKL